MTSATHLARASGGNEPGATIERKQCKRKLDLTDTKTKKIYSQAQKTNSDSDEEFDDRQQRVIFNKKMKLTPSTMTIRCSNINIKGSELIEIVHNRVKRFYEHIIDLACEYEKDIGGAIIPSPAVENGILLIRNPLDWFMSLGGWKGMMPSEEVMGYFFLDPRLDVRGKKFKGVQIFGSDVVFPIIDHRIHLPKHFSINNEDITVGWKKKPDGGWDKIYKTDLSYPQIVKAIETIKKQFKVNDSAIAHLQLYALKNEEFDFTWFKNLSENDQKKLHQFMCYLNGLMFGIEASGLNAALITGLMTLDLIKKKQLTYSLAFKANADGGVYPFACFGTNKGTYNAREQILLFRSDEETSLSMKNFRKDPSLSPVALKEAILITQWLHQNGVISKDTPHDEQAQKIIDAVYELMCGYFSACYTIP